ncbi:MAG: chemotaxis protein CheW [Atopostipes suicloacalis]|nr:chemotaxis protein CheW [Atopostipes suicloacalis]
MSQFIVYRVGKQKFAVSISSTSRIIALESVTAVPDSTDFMMGVMETEGDVLPIIDLSQRFYDIELKDTKNAQVVVILWNNEEIGLAVDEVINIVDFEENQIDFETEKYTKIGSNRELSPIQSFIRTEEGIILELNKLN